MHNQSSVEHLPRNFYSQTPEATAVCAVKGRWDGVRLEGVAFLSVSYMAVPVGEVDDAKTVEGLSMNQIDSIDTMLGELKPTLEQ